MISQIHEDALRTRLWLNPKVSLREKKQVLNLFEGEPGKRISAAVRLGKMGENARHAIPCLAFCLNDLYHPVRLAAAVALGKTGHYDAIKHLDRSLNGTLLNKVTVHRGTPEEASKVKKFVETVCKAIENSGEKRATELLTKRMLTTLQKLKRTTRIRADQNGKLMGANPSLVFNALVMDAVMASMKRIKSKITKAPDREREPEAFALYVMNPENAWVFRIFYADVLNPEFKRHPEEWWHLRAQRYLT